MNRDEFLLSKWPRFPAVPEGEWTCAPVGELLRSGQWNLAREIKFHEELIPALELMKLITMGDRVAVKTGSTGIIEEIQLLTPGGAPSSDSQPTHFREFSHFLRAVREYFWSLDFLETPTPTLVECPGMEAHLDPFAVAVGEEKNRYLPTSPEIHLKKRLCQDFEKIFEIRPCFRKDPRTPLHRSEFMMLEWYRSYGTLDDLQVDIEGLLGHLKAHGFWKREVEIGRTGFPELFRTHLGFQLEPETSHGELKALLRERKIHFTESDTKVDLIHRLILEIFEPRFEGLFFLEDFPAEMAVLSRIGANGFARRFELYADQVELANAFDEVNDPRVQEERWERDLEERRALGKPALPMDHELIELMETRGMPPGAGIALGLDRLFMVGMGLREIHDIGF